MINVYFIPFIMRIRFMSFNRPNNDSTIFLSNGIKISLSPEKEKGSLLTYVNPYKNPPEEHCRRTAQPCDGVKRMFALLNNQYAAVFYLGIGNSILLWRLSDLTPMRFESSEEIVDVGNT